MTQFDKALGFFIFTLAILCVSVVFSELQGSKQVITQVVTQFQGEK